MRGKAVAQATKCGLNYSGLFQVIFQKSSKLLYFKVLLSNEGFKPEGMGRCADR
jgi:hypothetical protein